MEGCRNGCAGGKSPRAFCATIAMLKAIGPPASNTLVKQRTEVLWKQSNVETGNHCGQRGGILLHNACSGPEWADLEKRRSVPEQKVIAQIGLLNCNGIEIRDLQC
jgi:hypothetical protein